VVIQVKVTLTALVEIDERAWEGEEPTPTNVLRRYREDCMRDYTDAYQAGVDIDDKGGEVTEVSVELADPTPYVGAVGEPRESA
jgi:hypothetical protein